MPPLPLPPRERAGVRVKPSRRRNQFRGFLPMSAMPVLIAVLCIMAIAYRYYSAFLAAKVAALDDSRPTPAMRRRMGRIITRPTSGCCSAITSPRSAGRGR